MCPNPFALRLEASLLLFCETACGRRYLDEVLQLEASHHHFDVQERRDHI
jgi:hypothetical protein